MGYDALNPLASVERYDPANNSWSSAAALATPRYQFTATLLRDGTVLVTGGYNGNNLSSAERYDPVADAWMPTTNGMTTTRYNHACNPAQRRHRAD